jgi:hypothetical protein
MNPNDRACHQSEKFKSTPKPVPKLTTLSFAMFMLHTGFFSGLVVGLVVGSLVTLAFN